MIYLLADENYFDSIPMAKYNLEKIIRKIMHIIRFDSYIEDCRKKLNTFYASLLDPEYADALGFTNWISFVEHENLQEVSTMLYILCMIFKVDIFISCKDESERDSIISWIDFQAQSHTYFWNILAKDVCCI